MHNENGHEKRNLKKLACVSTTDSFLVRDSPKTTVHYKKIVAKDYVPRSAGEAAANLLTLLEIYTSEKCVRLFRDVTLEPCLQPLRDFELELFKSEQDLGGVFPELIE